MPIQERIYWSGIVTRASADELTKRPSFIFHSMADVAYAPAPISPVASATLGLHLLTFDGAIPTAVKTIYIWAVCTPVSAMRLAFPFILEVAYTGRSFFSAAMHCVCFLLTRCLADAGAKADVYPFVAAVHKDVTSLTNSYDFSVDAVAATATDLPDIFSNRSSATSSKCSAYCTAAFTSVPGSAADTRLLISSSC